MDEMKKEQISVRILHTSRNLLYHCFPHLDAAFAGLAYRLDEKTRMLRIDGESMFYEPDSLIRRYIADSESVSRGYLHMILHCLYLHPWPDFSVEPRIWNLACDMAVERMIEREQREELTDSLAAEKEKQKNNIMGDKAYSAQQLYQILKDTITETELTEMEALFCFDDHTCWYEEARVGRRETMIRKWSRLHTQAGESRKKRRAGTMAGNAQELLNGESHARFDYRSYLKQFSVLREEVELDMESFDYIFYHLGIQNYGNMPLIEPLEYQEVNRLEELVIAIDTSGSCSREVVQQFLAETWQMLSQRENFFRKMKVHLIQCDTHIEEAVVIHSEEEWKDYSKKIRIQGRGGTDFRPVFRHVEELQKKQIIRNLKALIYFTDGDGIYPKEQTSYETAFVFLREKAKTDQVPPWATILMI